MLIQGAIINKIRKEKHMTINDLTEGIMDSSTFIRFVENKNTPSAESFVSLLRSLKVTYQEYEYVKSGFAPTETDYYSDLLKDAVADLNMKKLQSLIKELEHTNRNDELNDFLIVSKIIFQQVSSQKADEVLVQDIKQRLFHTDCWFHHEIAIFNNLIFIFSTEEIMLCLPRAINNLDSYSTVTSYGSETFRLIINAGISLLMRKDLHSALKLSRKIENYTLNQDFFFERIYRDFFQHLVLYASGDLEQEDNLSQLINGLEYLHETFFSKQFSRMINTVKQLYLQPSSTE